MMRVVLFILVISLLSVCQTVAAQTDWDVRKKQDLLQVSVNITDEAGQPIPYVTVWTAIPHRPDDELTLTPQDLWRITQRYKSSFEFATQYNHIVHHNHVTFMGNADGLLKDIIDYGGENGYPYIRPDKMQLSYTFMKRGYLPTQLNISVGLEKSVAGKVTLKRDPSHAIEDQPYLQRFEAIRYDLSDTAKDEKISIETHQHNEKIRLELEGLANQANAKGDNKAAARIYMRMVYLPSIHFYQGRPSGWSHQEPYKIQAVAYRQKAYALDKENPYIVGSSLYDEVFPLGVTPHRLEGVNRDKFENYLIKFEEFLNIKESEVRPKDYQVFASLHEYSNDEKQFFATEKWWRKFYEFEPKLYSKEFVEQAVKDFKRRKFAVK